MLRYCHGDANFQSCRLRSASGPSECLYSCTLVAEMYLCSHLVNAFATRRFRQIPLVFSLLLLVAVVKRCLYELVGRDVSWRLRVTQWSRAVLSMSPWILPAGARPVVMLPVSRWSAYSPAWRHWHQRVWRRREWCRGGQLPQQQCTYDSASHQRLLRRPVSQQRNLHQPQRRIHLPVSTWMGRYHLTNGRQLLLGKNSTNKSNVFNQYVEPINSAII